MSQYVRLDCSTSWLPHCKTTLSVSVYFLGDYWYEVGFIDLLNITLCCHFCYMSIWVGPINEVTLNSAWSLSPLQISPVSTHCSTLRTCRRSHHTLLWSMWTPQDSRRVHPHSPRGERPVHSSVVVLNIISNMTKYHHNHDSYVIIIGILCPSQLPVPYHGWALWDAALCHDSTEVSSPAVFP